MTKLLKTVDSKMKDAHAALLHNFSKTRTGRANVSALEDIFIDYYGVSTPIKQLCNISIPEPRLIVIQPWDKQILVTIEKAFLASNIGVTPENDGNVLRLPFQPLTEETRRDIVKQVKKMAEDGKIEVRNIRRFGNDEAKQMKNDSEISEDDEKKILKDIQELTDKWVKEISASAKTKEQEIMEV
ncbi:MAG: ribosome recycling factor [Candidatus Cloacimonetes bacterium]|nr:ribosome recycling factor [Candidatus Cloacimonadota bacterium]MBT6993514.1 ribosome recycling factor [Candidatus Cloacimonadota bacterium]MBT7470137.1 ribosome recycling factor [Candidatus Cloacimonadota bacterium]